MLSQSRPKSPTRTSSNSKIRYPSKDTGVLSKPQNQEEIPSRRQSNRKRPTTTTPATYPTEPEIEVLFVAVASRTTTPEPPSTPGLSGTGFKCEDEGFFPHPTDCKKYYWCLDSGPSELGIVAHQFTCPGGLVFNKAADSCDYTQNVLCSKVKLAKSKTTALPTTTSRATSTKRTTLYQTTRATTQSYQEVSLLVILNFVY